MNIVSSVNCSFENWPKKNGIFCYDIIFNLLQHQSGQCWMKKINFTSTL